MTKERWLAGLVTILGVVVMIVANRSVQFNQTMAPLFVILVFAAYVGGLWAGLLSAVIISGYTAWIMWPEQAWRAGVVIGCAFLIALLVGWLKRRARLSDTINGNIESLKEALAIIRYLLEYRRTLDQEILHTRLNQLEDIIGNLVTRVYGWHQLRQEMTEVEKFYKEDQRID